MTEDSLRVMTWNIHGRFLRDVESLAAEISKFAPHIIGLQEVHHHHATHLAETLHMSSVWAFKHNPFWPVLRSRAEGLAILSHHPIESREEVILSDSAHKRSHRRRLAIIATIRVNTEIVTVVNTHLASHRDRNERLSQAEVLHRHMDRHIATPWILTADLNDHNEPEIAEALEGGTAHDAWTEQHGHRNGATCPSSTPSMRIDHIIFSREFPIEDVFVPESTETLRTLSDHLPVVAVTLVLGSDTHNP